MQTIVVVIVAGRREGRGRGEERKGSEESGGEDKEDRGGPQVDGEEDGLQWSIT